MKLITTFVVGIIIGWYLHTFVRHIESVASAIYDVADGNSAKVLVPLIINTPTTSITSNVEKNIVKNTRIQKNLEISQIQYTQTKTIQVHSPTYLMSKINTFVVAKNYPQALLLLSDLLSQVQIIYPEQTLKNLFIKLVKLHLKNIDSVTKKIEFLNKMLYVFPNSLELRFLLAQELLKIKEYIEAKYQISFLEYHLDWKDKFELIKQQIEYGILFLDGEISIPLIKKHNAWHIKAIIDGKLANLVLDTGASITVVSSDFIASDTAKYMTLNTANGQIKATQSTLESFVVGEVTRNDLVVAGLPVDKLPPGVDGLLGIDWLGNFNFIIDAKNHTLQLTKK